MAQSAKNCRNRQQFKIFRSLVKVRLLFVGMSQNNQVSGDASNLYCG
jgi:hypothetical protein